MSAPPMDPRYEQRLRDEVIYLHSLWHQGPPRPSTATVFTRHLQPTQPTHFKKETPKNRRRKKRKNKTPNSSPGAEWPCPPTPPQPPTEWPSFPKLPEPNPPVTPEENSKLTGIKAQKNALNAAREFFLRNSGNGDDDDDSDAIDSSGSEGEDELMEGDDGREEYGFFVKLLMEDGELKEHYVKNYAEGEFNCLVCGAIGAKKMGKKYRGCMALVQHSITISKTKRRQAHRAFAQAVCKVVGWDIDQLPTIVSSLSEKKVNADLPIKESNVDSIGNDGGIVVASEHTSSDVQVNADLVIKESNVDSVGAVVSMPIEHTSSDVQVNADLAITDSNLDSIGDDDRIAVASEHTSSDVQDNTGGLVSETAVGSLVNELTSDNKETTTPGVDPMEGNVAEIVPESGATGGGVSQSGNHIAEATPDENNGTGNEMQDLQMDNTPIIGQELGNETNNTM